MLLRYQLVLLPALAVYFLSQLLAWISMKKSHDELPTPTPTAILGISPPFNNKRRPLQRSPLNNITVDIISIGSRHRRPLQHMQKQTFGSHVMVRNFFAITEADDGGGPHCSEHLTQNDTLAIGELCSSAAFHRDRPMMLQRIRHHVFKFGSDKQLQSWRDPTRIAGWMCAQKRPLMGLLKALDVMYKKSDLFPDFLIVLDDDTYYNMDLFRESVASQIDPRKTVMASPCIFTSPLRYPHGGMGTVWTKGLLNAIRKPIRCGTPKNKNICEYIQQNNFGERHLFREGMGLLDIVKAYSAKYKFMDYQHWAPATGGFCLHSDMVWGWLMHMVTVKMHPRLKIQPWPHNGGGDDMTQMCANEGQHCNATSPVCHYQSTKSMLRFHKENLSHSPQSFMHAEDG